MNCWNSSNWRLASAIAFRSRAWRSAGIHCRSACGGEVQRGRRVEQDLEAGLLGLIDGQDGRLAAEDEVQLLVAGHLPADPPHRVHAAQAVDDDGVGAGLEVLPGALDGVVEVGRVGPGDDGERRLARLERRGELAEVALHREHLLALGVTAALRRDLVLHLDPRDPGGLHLVDRAADVLLVPVAVVDVDHDRDVDGVDDVARELRGLRERREPDVRVAQEARGDPVAAQEDGLEARVLADERAQHVVAAGQRDRLRAGEAGAKQLGHPVDRVRHGESPRSAGQAYTARSPCRKSSKRIMSGAIRPR